MPKWTVHSLRNEVLRIVDSFERQWSPVDPDWKPKYRVEVGRTDRSGFVFDRRGEYLTVRVAWPEDKTSGDEQKKLVANIPGFIGWSGRGHKRAAHFLADSHQWSCDCGAVGPWTTMKKAKQGRRLHIMKHNKEGK